MFICSCSSLCSCPFDHNDILFLLNLHQIQYIDKHTIISVTERNCFCWNLQEYEPKRVYQVKGLPDCSAVMNSNSVFMQTFDDPNSTLSGYQDGGTSQRSVNILYCLAGHKISAGEVNTQGSRDKKSGSGSTKEVSDGVLYNVHIQQHAQIYTHS